MRNNFIGLNKLYLIFKASYIYILTKLTMVADSKKKAIGNKIALIQLFFQA